MPGLPIGAIHQGNPSIFTQKGCVEPRHDPMCPKAQLPKWKPQPSRLGRRLRTCWTLSVRVRKRPLILPLGHEKVLVV